MGRVPRQAVTVCAEYVRVHECARRVRVLSIRDRDVERSQSCGDEEVGAGGMM
jgi:hypothetical protein